MSKERAAWNFRYEKGLVDIMRDHVNIPLFRGQNGWTVEGWRSISEKFTQMYPLAHFTKQQLQEKEKDLKGSWKAIRDAKKDSGVGWNDSLCLVIADPDKWKKLIDDNGKMARFQKKPFPLFEDCMSLYAGSVATGDLNFTSIEHLEPAPVAPTASIAPTAISESTNQFASLDGQDFTSAHNEAQSAPSNQNSVQGASGGRKRKQSHIGAAIENWVEYKKMQTDKTMEALDEKKKQDEEFSVQKCLDEVVAMDGLTDVEKSYAMDIFKSQIDGDIHEDVGQKCSLYLVQAPD